MTRYYFDLVDRAGGRLTDVEGVEFSSLEAAKADALRMLGEMAAENLTAGEPAHVSIEIRFEDETVCSVSLDAGADC